MWGLLHLIAPAANSDDAGTESVKAIEDSQFGQTRNIPAPAESFDQQHCRIHAAPLDIGLIPFVRAAVCEVTT